jgi:hypothetical protein
MADHDLEQIRAIVHEALAPMQADLTALKTKADSWPDLHLLLTAVKRQQADITGFRDDMRVLTAMVTRLDNSHSMLLDELRATHAQVARLIDRVLKIEEERAPPL